jgi:carbon monoxide dehydrogenase subunit G
MPKVSVSQEVAVPPERVWELASNLSRYGEWLTMHEGFTTDVPADPKAGDTYKQKVKLMGMPAEIAWRVVTAEAPGKLELAGDGPMNVKANNRTTIEPSGEGSRITLEMEFNGPALAGPMAGMVEKQAGSAAKESLAKFVALLG